MKTLAIVMLAATSAAAWGGPTPAGTDPVTQDQFNSYQSAESFVTNSAIAGNQATQAQVNGQQSQINGLSDRLDKLDGMKMLVEADIRVYDGKRFAVSLFNSYDAAHSANFAAGTRITLKLGSSYEERLLAAQTKRIEALEAMLKGAK